MSEQTSKELALVRREDGGSCRKNFNLGIFKINELRESLVFDTDHVFFESSLLYTRIITLPLYWHTEPGI